jgi:hypothetical protein
VLHIPVGKGVIFKWVPTSRVGLLPLPLITPLSTMACHCPLAQHRQTRVSSGSSFFCHAGAMYDSYNIRLFFQTSSEKWRQ